MVDADALTQATLVFLVNQTVSVVVVAEHCAWLYIGNFKGDFDVSTLNNIATTKPDNNFAIDIWLNYILL